MFKKVLLFLLTLAMPIFLFAQSSGKIAGVVKDKETGEPLPGVNVVLQDTYFGATTDVDGYYVILNVPVGVYNIEASYVGYAKAVIKGIRVSAGVTTEQNFELQPTTLELGEAVVVTAQRPLVEKNVTQSYSLVTSDQIETIPVRGLQNILALQPSVVVQDGAVHIRGGREEEVGYYLDGASTQNALNNTNAIYVIQDAVEEVQVLTGGYTAEFGGANSGIIKAELKTGTPDYHFSADFQTDKFADEGEKFLGTYSYQHHIGAVTLSGPLFSKKIRFFLAGENNYQGDYSVRFSKGFQFNNLIDTNPNNTEHDTVSITYPDGFTPHHKSNRYALNGTLLFDFSPIRFRVGGTFNTRRTYLDGDPWLSMLNDRQVYDDLNTFMLTGKLTHVLSPKTYYDVTVGVFNYSLERGDSYFDKEWKSWYDSTKVAAHGVTYRDRWRPKYNYILEGIPFERQGAPSNWYRKLNQNYISGAVKFTSQIGRYHELKVGAEARQYTVRYFDIAPSVMLYTADTAYANARGDYPETYGSLANVPVDVWVTQGGVDAYGYDAYGNEINADKTYKNGIYIQGPKKPLFGSFFIQDKIEYEDLVVNAGVRVDYFDSDDYTLRDPSDPKVDKSTSLVKKDEWKKVDPFIEVSPRLGFSFPVSEKTVFYLQYGKFVQMPQLNQIYFSTNRMSRQIVQGGFYYINPIGFGLEPIKTTNYEIGFRQQLGQFAAFDITGFYRNIKGQVQVDLQQAAPGADVQSYERFVNGDFATTKGVEVKLTMRRVNRLQAQINYTLTDAEGTGSSNTSYHAAIQRGTIKPTVVSPLDYSQTHRGSINLDYRFGAGDGGPVLERFGANLLFTFNSGHPYTLVYAPPGGQVDPYSAGVDYMWDTRSREALEKLNSSTTPWVYNLDLRLDKTFTIYKNLDATVYLRVNNLLNTKNVINVFEKTGSATDDGFLSDPTISGDVVNRLGDTYVQMYRAINLENGGAYRSIVGRELFDHPRQIFLGIKFSY